MRCGLTRGAVREAGERELGAHSLSPHPSPARTAIPTPTPKSQGTVPGRGRRALKRPLD